MKLMLAAATVAVGLSACTGSAGSGGAEPPSPSEAVVSAPVSPRAGARAVMPYTPEERAERTRAFARLDANHNGALTQDEMASAVRLQASLMLSRYDLDHDDGLSRAELDNTRTAAAELEELFRQDRNRDGVLTAQELASGAQEAFGRRDLDRDGTQSLEEFLTRPPDV